MLNLFHVKHGKVGIFHSIKSQITANMVEKRVQAYLGAYVETQHISRETSRNGR